MLEAGQIAITDFRCADVAMGNHILTPYKKLTVPDTAEFKQFSSYLKRQPSKQIILADFDSPAAFRAAFKKSIQSKERIEVPEIQGGGGLAATKDSIELPMSWFYRDNDTSTPERGSYPPVSNHVIEFDENFDIKLTTDHSLVNYHLAFISTDKHSLDKFGQAWQLFISKHDLQNYKFMGIGTLFGQQMEVECSIVTRDVIWSDISDPEQAGRLLGKQTDIEVMIEVVQGELIARRPVINVQLENPYEADDILVTTATV